MLGGPSIIATRVFMRSENSKSLALERHVLPTPIISHGDSPAFPISIARAYEEPKLGHN